MPPASGEGQDHPFSRTELLIGKESLARLSASRVAVFGIGGVGSYAVEGLARAGVGHLILVDHDTVCASNINRQIHATHRTIGRPKVEVMKERIRDINPQAEVVTHQRFYLPGEADDLLSPNYDYIIDAIDTVSAKIGLVVAARKLGVPIISCMGTGNKLNPGLFRVADIYETSVCPLAKVMRRELRKRGVGSLTVVYSPEEPLRPAQRGDLAGNTTPESGQPGKRSRSVPGSISFVPPVAGLMMAGEVVRHLAGIET